MKPCNEDNNYHYEKGAFITFEERNGFYRQMKTIQKFEVMSVVKPLVPFHANE